ncbi:MAG: heme biosynthesis HemY N-terminal domain-containing protein [Burkholderiales bacterium]
MRAVIWFTLLFVAAVVAATTLGTNDGLVSFYWSGWRMDVSLNLFLLALVGTCFALVTVIQTVSTLVGLPSRALKWRVARRDKSAQAWLRDAQAQYFGGRYSRAHRSAQRALEIQADTPELAQDNEFTVLGHLLAAGSLHRLQDRVPRDEQLRKALDISHRSAAARSAEEGARMLAAEWALDDRDATRALELLAELPPGVGRRTQALRLKLQATRLARQPMEALKTARLLAKHQGFSKVAAVGLLRSLAFEALEDGRDADQVRRTWEQLDVADRRDPFVAARAATRVAQLGAPDVGRQWLRPFWDAIDSASGEDREVLAHGLVACVAGIGADWLPRLEAAWQAHPRDGAIAFAAGCALAERQLWGKARVALQQAADDATLPASSRRRAWRQLAQLAREQGDETRAAECFAAASQIG